jgi:hypothetical protein
MARVRLTIETGGGEITVEDYVGPPSTTGDENTYDTLASVIRRAAAAIAGPDRYGETIATICGLLVQTNGIPRTSPLLAAAAVMHERLTNETAAMREQANADG